MLLILHEAPVRKEHAFITLRLLNIIQIGTTVEQCPSGHLGFHRHSTVLGPHLSQLYCFPMHVGLFMGSAPSLGGLSLLFIRIPSFEMWLDAFCHTVCLISADKWYFHCSISIGVFIFEK